jgi:hypothetical protein
MRTLYKGAVACILCMLMAALCHAQSIKGTVLDSLGKPVAYASVNLKSGNLIIAYTTSGDKGTYTIAVPADADKTKLQLEVSCIGFKKAMQPVSSFTTPYNFKLSGTSHQLQTVTIKDKNPRLRRIGDTLSYKVSDFSSPQDRVIGDVIKKMPGIDVDKNGKISYNGKAISNLYIGGDNLLDDKYNVATSSIPNGVVDQVQVMENHQPIKMLKDKVVSDDVALNLTFKKDAKLQLVGQETVGAGVPGNYYGELNAMAFKDKYKAINYIKGNNVGTDISYDLISQNFSQGADAPNTLLSLGTAGDPDLPRNRYLFNKSGMINLNNLVNIKKDVQLRANMSYFHDYQRQDYSKTTNIAIGGTNVNYTEVQRNNRQPDILHGQFLYNANKSNYYLNNNLSIDYGRNTGISGLISNGAPVNQTFKDNTLNINNTFNLMRTLKNNNIMEFYSNLTYSNEPENLVIGPNLNPQIFNASHSNANYASLTQNTNVPNYSTNNYMAYRIPGNNITQGYRAGFAAIKQTLTSDFSVTQLDNTTNLFSDTATNNLNWNRNRLYAEASYDYPGKIWKVNVTLPLSLQETMYNDGRYKLDKSLTRLYFDPRLSVKFQSGIENYFTANYGFRNSIGNIQDVYRGYILSNYRSLGANNADLTERQSQSASLGFNYRKAITLFFFGLNASYFHQSANTISSSILSNNISQRIVLPFDNNIDSWNFSGTISKYSFGLRTTFSGGVSYGTTKLNQFQNGLTLPYNTISKSVNAGADTKVSSKVNVSYRATYLETTSKLATALASSSQFQRLTQTASINYNPLSNLFTSLSGDHYYTYQKGANDLKYIFADASLRYKFKKAKLDLEVTAQNLFDTKNYSAVYLSANISTTSTYNIPGRIILGKVMFTL